MSKNSPSTRTHRAIVSLSQIYAYKTWGPIVGPKEKHQPNPRWEKNAQPQREAQEAVEDAST